MPSDPKVSQRVRVAVEGRGFEERFFFGGDAWFMQGHFALGVYRDRLTCRIGPDAAAQAIDGGTAAPMDLTGNPMKGWVFVDAEHFEQAGQINDWVERVHGFVSTLPAKTAKAKKNK